MDARNYFCIGCGRELTDMTSGPRQPCISCGSMARTSKVEIHAAAEARVYLKTHTKHREAGNKVVREVYAGDDYRYSDGTWSYLYRLIDRTRNWYEERILSRETGKIIHQKSLPLTEHRKAPKAKNRADGGDKP